MDTSLKPFLSIPFHAHARKSNLNPAVTFGTRKGKAVTGKQALDSPIYAPRVESTLCTSMDSRRHGPKRPAAPAGVISSIQATSPLSGFCATAPVNWPALVYEEGRDRQGRPKGTRNRQTAAGNDSRLFPKRVLLRRGSFKGSFFTGRESDRPAS